MFFHLGACLALNEVQNCKQIHQQTEDCEEFGVDEQ